MREIRSKDNRIIKFVKKLNDKKWRDKENLYIIEGMNLIEEALGYGIEIKLLIINSDSRFAQNHSEWIKENADNNKIDIYTVPENIFRGLSDVETPQDILAVVRKTSEVFNISDRLIVLDRIRDPGNMGSLIRTAKAAGFGVMLIKGCVDIYSPKVVRAASGAIFTTSVTTSDSAHDALEKLSEYEIFIADMEGERTLYETDFVNRIDKGIKIAFVLGNEGSGVDSSFIKGVDTKLRIPMYGGTESLNVAVAGALLMYETVRSKNI